MICLILIYVISEQWKLQLIFGTYAKKICFSRGKYFISNIVYHQ